MQVSLVVCEVTNQLCKLCFLRYSFYPWGMCLVFGNVKGIIYPQKGTPQTTKETYFGLCVRLHSSSGIGITQAHLAMNGIETQLGFFQNDFEEQPLFQQLALCRKCILVRLFTVKTLLSLPSPLPLNTCTPRQTHNLLVLFPQFIWHLFPQMDQRLVLKIILSPFKTRKRKLKQNIGIKNCFLVLRFSEISSQKKIDEKAVELRMQNDWGEFISQICKHAHCLNV